MVLVAIVPAGAKEVLAKKFVQVISEEFNHARRALNPDKAERLVQWYFQRIGADTAIPAKNEADKDGDTDVVATFDPIRTIIYIQVKFHSGLTSGWATERISRYRRDKERRDDGYTKLGWSISTADGFSSECQEAADLNEITLITGPEFA